MELLIKKLKDQGYNVNLKYGYEINANCCIDNVQYVLVDNLKKVCAIIYNKYNEKYSFDYFKYFYEGEEALGVKSDTIESCRIYDFKDEEYTFNFIKRYLDGNEFEYIKDKLTTTDNTKNDKLKEYKIILDRLGYETIIALKEQTELLLINKNSTTIALYIEDNKIKISNSIYFYEENKVEFISIDNIPKMDIDIIEKYFFTPLDLIKQEKESI